MPAEARRGFEVARISVENLRELVELRLLLEYAIGVAFAMSMSRGKGAWSPSIRSWR